MDPRIPPLGMKDLPGPKPLESRLSVPGLTAGGRGMEGSTTHLCGVPLTRAGARTPRALWGPTAQGRNGWRHLLIRSKQGKVKRGVSITKLLLVTDW